MGLSSNPVVKRFMEMGEAQVGRLANQLLANERFVQAVQQMVSRTLAARGMLDKSLRSALATMNLPSTADVEELRRRLDDLDRTITELDAKMDELRERLAGGAGQATRGATRAKSSGAGKKGAAGRRTAAGKKTEG